MYGEDAAEPVRVTRTTGVIQPDSRTLRAEIDIENKDGLLRPGMYAFVQIKAETAGAMVLPAAAVLPADETYYCFLVEDGKAVKYRVRVGRTDAGSVHVLEKRKAAAMGGKWTSFAGAERVVVGNLGASPTGRTCRPLRTSSATFAIHALRRSRGPSTAAPCPATAR